MLDWNVGRFLARTLPREVGSLRLADAHRTPDEDLCVWLVQFVPIDTPLHARPPWRFRTRVLWEPDNVQPMLSFGLHVHIELPKSAGRWLDYGVRRYNEDAEIKLCVFESSDGFLSLRASRTALLTRENAELLALKTPPAETVQSFFVIYKETIELLFQAWKQAHLFSKNYRTLH